MSSVNNKNQGIGLAVPKFLDGSDYNSVGAVSMELQSAVLSTLIDKIPTQGTKLY